MKILAFTTKNRLIYIRIEETIEEEVTPGLKWERKRITHFTTDHHSFTYFRIRREVPDIVIFFDTRHQLQERLSMFGRYV